MNYKKLKEAFEQIGMGFNLLAQAIDDDKDTGRVEINKKAKSEVAVESEKENPKKSKKSSKVVKEEEEEEKVVELEKVKKTKKKTTTVAPKEDEKEEVEEDELTEEILNKMTYNEVKAKAKELGVKAVGSKKLIIENILALVNPTDDEEEVEEDDIEDEELENEEEDEEEEEEEDTLYDRIVADLEEYSDDDLKEILDDIGVSSKGKRQALLAKIVKAVEEGKLEWEDDEEDVVEDEDSSDDTEQEEIKGSKTRIAVMEDYEEKLREDIEEGDISDKKILKFLKSYYNDNYKSTGVEADREEYIRIQCELIDDDGDLNNLEEAYYVGDDVYCCGEALKEVDGVLYCEHCGTEYDLED